MNSINSNFKRAWSYKWKAKRKVNTIQELKFKDTILPNVETATHLGMQRSKTDKETIENTVNENIKKARRTAHCLMAA